MELQEQHYHCFKYVIYDKGKLVLLVLEQDFFRDLFYAFYYVLYTLMIFPIASKLIQFLMYADYTIVCHILNKSM